MYLRYHLTVRSTDTQENPAKTVMQVGPGVLHTMEVSFPPGCAGLVHVFVTHWEQQLWPWNTGDTFAWDDYTIRMTGIEFPITTPPYTFTLYGWSEDDTFEHLIVCRLGIAAPAFVASGGWGVLPE